MPYYTVNKELHMQTPYGFGDDYESVIWLRYTRKLRIEDCSEPYARAVVFEACKRLAPLLNYNVAQEMEVKAVRAYDDALSADAEDIDTESFQLFRPPNDSDSFERSLEQIGQLDPNAPKVPGPARF